MILFLVLETFDSIVYASFLFFPHRIFFTCHYLTALATFFFSWLPEHITLLARFSGEPSPVKSTVTKAVAEFRRTHADTWNVQKELFTEEQIEVAF